uniref:AAA ATPase domain-containing protein n=1 Tax=Candidatus Kentrum sp. FW TaxID=2126338 RepID=A0A450U4E9_9GAMM|nr:MAG: AAA ATPase domain-containing protein [Candidatus Kentron sp. FW]
MNNHDTPNSTFRARLGDPRHPGFLPQDRRLARIRPGQNPFVSDTPLEENAPTFFGRMDTLREILATLRHPDKPGCVSLSGERRIGKSSLLNQVFAALGKEENLIGIFADAQGWHDRYSTVDFFADLHRTIDEALPKVQGAFSPSPINYSEFRDFIGEKAEENYRFVLILDEFDTIATNPKFNATFFDNLRHLGSTPEHAFGFLLASRRSLAELQERHREFGGSSFGNIFGPAHILGLLQPEETQALMQEPWQKSPRGSIPLSEQEISKIERRVSRHPAFIQMIMEKQWIAHQQNSSLDWERIVKLESEKDLQLLWQDRTPEEIKILLKIAENEPLTEEDLSEETILFDLRTRGLITEDNRLFTDMLGEFIPDDVIEDAIPSKKAFDGILKWAKKAGRIRNMWKSGNSG